MASPEAANTTDAECCPCCSRQLPRGWFAAAARTAETGTCPHCGEAFRLDTVRAFH